MDKKKATLILAKALGDKLERLVIIESSYKDELVKKAFAVYQIDNPIMLDYDDGCYYDNEYQDKKGILDILVHKESFAGTNYFFLESIPVSTDGPSSRFAATPYALIGEKEENDLRNSFYKDVNPNVLSAMDVLGVENYVELYELYSKGGMGEEFLDNYGLYLKFVNSLSDLAFNNYDNVSKCRFESYFNLNVRNVNKKLKKNNIEPITTSNNRIVKSRITYMVNQFEKYASLKEYINLLPSFLNFVFTVPYEDKNVEINKEILKSFSEKLDYVGILVKEYSQGKCFQEYFSCLDAGRQENVIHALKSVPRNPICDPFLWKKGFRSMDLDYLDLYKEDAEGFMEYFSSKNPEEKKVILEDIMDCDFVNGDVADWLNKNEPELVKEVGLNG